MEIEKRGHILDSSQLLKVQVLNVVNTTERQTTVRQSFSSSGAYFQGRCH